MNILKGITLVLIFIFGILIQPFLWLISNFVPKDKSIYYHNLRKFEHSKCNCNSLWYNSFVSQNEFEKLYSGILNQFNPIGHTAWYSPIPTVKFLFYEYGAQNAEGGFIYECKACNHLWELSYPENAYRGYFKGIDLNKEMIKRYIKEKN